MSLWGHIMAWMPWRTASSEASRRADAAITGAMRATEDVEQAARDLSTSAGRVATSAEAVEQGAQRRVQAQEARRQSRPPRVIESRILELLAGMEAEASRARKERH